MKKLALPAGGPLLTTLALMLLLIATACENDDEYVRPISNYVLKFNFGNGLNMVVGEPAVLKPVDPTGLFINPPPETVWTWRILDRPDKSQPVLADADKVSAILNVDLPGEYQIELTGSFKEQLVVDTLVAYAHLVNKLSGNYQELFETEGGNINRLYVYQDQLYAGGNFSSIGGVEAYGIAVYDGITWKPLQEGLKEDYSKYYSTVNDLIEYQGEIYIAGTFGTPGGTESPAIARWNGHQWVEVPGIDLNVITVVEDDWDPYTYLENSGRTFEIFQDDLYISGYFNNKNSQSSPYMIMKWDGSQLSGVPVELDEVNDIITFNDSFHASGFIHGSTRPAVASFNGSEWKILEIKDQFHPAYFVYYYYLSDPMVVFQDKLYTTLVGWNAPPPGTYSFPGTSELIVWDGVDFIEIGKPFSRSFNSISTLEVIDNTLYIGGGFGKEVAGAKSNGLVTWNGEEWGVVASGSGVLINEIQQYQNKLFVAGYFQSIAGIAVWQPN